MDLPKELSQFFPNRVVADSKNLHSYSHDTSIFEVEPKVVVFPKTVQEVEKLVSFVSENKRTGTEVSITCRSGGSDMSGGAINDSIIVDFSKYFNYLGAIEEEGTEVQPGVFYRDFEKEADKKGLYFASYPASKNICAFGGMVNNNAGGEKTLVHGKTIDHVSQLKVVLSDGKEYQFEALSKNELEKKLRQKDFEGEIYRKMFELLQANYDLLKKAKPKVSKNSTGYNLWDIWDRETFDLTKLFVGSQGTLGITTGIKVKLVKEKNFSGLLVLYLDDIALLPELVNTVVPTQPESFEAFDDHTMKLALRFIPKFMEILGWRGTLDMGITFLPQLLQFLLFGIPKFTLLVEYEGETQAEVETKLEKLKASIEKFNLRTRLAKNKREAQKYWVIRRESFNLLRKNIKDKHTAPFIDDLIVPPAQLPEFFPQLTKILDENELLYTIAGHMGDGNFHIIPLMDLRIKSEREKIPTVAKKVNELVFQYGGSMSGEHNDGMIRGPFLEEMYGEEVFALFKKTKEIFDPQNIFNPHKKTDASMEFSTHHIRLHF